MAHKRETIRKAVVAAVTGLATTGSNVFNGITYDLEAADLPALVVLVAEREPETLVEEMDVCGAVEIRALPITVEAKTKRTADLLDTLDDIAEEIEVAVAADSGISALVVDIRLTSTTFDVEGGAEKPAGTLILDYVALYEVNRTAPSA